MKNYCMRNNETIFPKSQICVEPINHCVTGTYAPSITFKANVIFIPDLQLIHNEMRYLCSAYM